MVPPLIKRNAPYGETPEMPLDWSLHDRSELPGEVIMYYKDPDTDLLSPVASPELLDEDQLMSGCYRNYSTPQRRNEYIWDISHRTTPGYGCNEFTPPFSAAVEQEILNVFDPSIDYHPWCRANCFKPFDRQRGLFWHWIRYYAVITASRLDTILYNGYIRNEDIPRLDVILARDHLFKVLTCQIPQETVEFTSNIEEDHLWRGVYGESYAKRSLIEKSPFHPKPIILEVGSIPIPGYRWIRVSLDGIDAVRGINYEMKSPRPLLWLFKNYEIDVETFAKLAEFQALHIPPFKFTNSALNEFRMQTDFLVMNACAINPTLTYESAYRAIDKYDFDVTPFDALGKQQKKFAPNGYYWCEEQHTDDLGYYVFQANVQDQIGVAATELVKWDCLTDTIKATRIKRRNIMFEVAVELQKFWDQVHAYRVKHQVTFKDFYRINNLVSLGEDLYEQ